MALNGLLQGNSVRDSAHRILSLKLFELSRRILVQKFVQREVAAAHLNLDLVANATHPDTLGAELIDTLRFPHEHDLESLAIRVVIDVLSQP